MYAWYLSIQQFALYFNPVLFYLARACAAVPLNHVLTTGTDLYRRSVDP